jgi:hypothetical protein
MVTGAGAATAEHEWAAPTVSQHSHPSVYVLFKS